MATVLAWLRWVVGQLQQWLRPPGAPSGGGTTVGGNVTVGRDFVGRDRIEKGGANEQ